MTTIVERDSSGPAVLLVLVVILLLVGGGLGFAYMNGAFGEKTTVIENNKTVENKTVVLPAPTVPVAPARAPEPKRHDQAPAR
jgi:hypothetical protein